jgi:peroxin-6
MPRHAVYTRLTPVAILNARPPPYAFPYPLTPQYYLETMAGPKETEVRVSRGDFERALRKLVPSVSAGEMEHYARVQEEFKGFAIGEKR